MNEPVPAKSFQGSSLCLAFQSVAALLFSKTFSVFSNAGDREVGANIHELSNAFAADTDERRQISQNRLIRVSSYCAICAFGWAFFGLYYVVREVYPTALLCIIAAVTLVVLCIFTLRLPAFRERYANVHLGVTFVGLTCECLMSGLSASSTVPYYCCIGVMAVHQSGIRTAIAWAILSSGCVAAMHFAFDAGQWPLWRSYNQLDNATSFAGLFLLVMWMAAQAEWFATKYFVLLLNNAKKLALIAGHDQLTQLGNRYRFREALKHASEEYERTGKDVGLLMLDVDSFKEVNDTLGHQAGDAVLQEVARRLSCVVGDISRVARIGGDEFTIIVRSASIAKLDQLATDVLQSLEKPVYAAEQEIQMTVSIGAALLPLHTQCTDELQAFADLAMYEAKQSEVSLAVYAPHMTEQLVRKRTLADKLALAIERDEFSLFFQPQVSIVTGHVIGVEALLRWNQKLDSEADNGEFASTAKISPAEFVPILESTGQIATVGRWVLEQACRQACDWLSMGIECCVSVNVSPIQFQSAEFVQDVLSVLEQTGIPPGYLDLEITEGVLVARLDETRHKLQQLKDVGVKISVDDFGTGYSSLAYLKHLPLDRLKIDRAFVKDIPANDDGALASAIIGLGHTLNLTVLAEGVETTEQLEFLSALNCEEYQGYLHAKPLPVVECTEILLADSVSRLQEQSVSTWACGAGVADVTANM